jgi:hypothetical protein
MDGLLNEDEYYYGTDPNNPDTDGGGESDGSEINRQVPKNPLNPADDTAKRPAFLKVLPLSEMVRLLYDYNAGQTPCASVRLFRSMTGQAGPFSLLVTETPPDGEYTDKVPNGTKVTYRSICDYSDGSSSAYVESPTAAPSLDPYPPEARIIINNGAAWTSRPEVQLNFSPLADLNPGEPDTFGDITEVMLSNSPDFGGAAWRSFGQGLPWTLAAVPPGSLANVYARFRDAAGNTSIGVEVASIPYELRLFMAVIKK